MDATPNPECWSAIDRLLLQTSDTMLQMAEIARRNETEGEMKIFYSHLSLHCLRLRNLECSQQSLSQLDARLVNETLSHLGSLVPEDNVKIDSPDVTPLESRLGTLNYDWDKVREQIDDIKLEFVRRWLNPTQDEAQRQIIEQRLEFCTLRLESKEPELASREPPVNPSSLNLRAPSHNIWKKAQSIFKAFLNCKGCSCPSQHDFSARLELGTYQENKHETSENRQNKSGRGRGRDRKPPRDSKLDSGLDLDLFLFMQPKWYQIRVQTVKERTVSFNLLDKAATSLEIAAPRSQKKVEILCQWISGKKSNSLLRFMLRLDAGELVDVGLEKTDFFVHKEAHPISLAECFEERQEYFTEKTKRILSLIMAYTVLHLNGTSWLQSEWGSANIKFFQTAACKTPLRPFLQTKLDELSNDCLHELDGLYSTHNCPVLVALAVVLMEICFVKPFKRLAEKHNVPLLDELGSRITLMDVDQVFNGCEEGNKEGLRSQIPEDYLLEAIDNCLNGSLWEDENQNPLDDATMRSLIYQHVVQPLETHLTHGFSHITVENVDKLAREIDFGNYGGILSTSKLGSQSSLRINQTPSPIPTWTSLSSPITQLKFDYSSPNFRNITSNYSRNCSSMIHSDQKRNDLSTIFNAEVPQPFHDEFLGARSDTSSIQSYKKWRQEYEHVYEKFISERVPDCPIPVVKIAILDTGIDKSHDYIEVRGERLKATYNCFDRSQRSVVDRNGHGTFAAGLIFDYARNAHIYVIKVADQNSNPNAKVVAHAIDYASNEWGVDIISMSLGWPSSDFDGFEELENSIDNAYHKKILLFAAASNSGGRLGRAYPASSPHVICVHSTDTYGNASGFSPTPRPNALNIATVGESIQSVWPMLLCDQKNPACIENRSGTSYATPILAGISAFLLEYARQHLPPNAASALKRKEHMEALLKRCAERGRDYGPRDGYYYVELSLATHNLFGRDLEGINDEILNILNL